MGISPYIHICVIIFSILLTLASSDESAHDVDQNLPNVDPANVLDEDKNLEDMTDEELEEICTSRGFELVREFNATTGDLLVYTHQDYVDAASECLQIEADLEEILMQHPEILEDVKKESERMMNERDRLHEELKQMQEDDKRKETESGRVKETNNINGVKSESVENESKERSTAQYSKAGPEKLTKSPEPIYDFKEITQEVMAQIKTDMTKLLNIVLPKPLRDQLAPSLKTLVSVAKRMGVSVYDLIRRHLEAFMDKSSNSHEDKRTASTTEVKSEEIVEQRNTI